MALGDLFKRSFGNLSGATPPPRYNKKDQLETARAQAARVDQYIEELGSPMALLERVEFQAGVAALSVPCFTGQELLALSKVPTDALWQMAVLAISRREAEPGLMDPLLALIDEVGPWQIYFLMEALLTHTPPERSLTGELLFRLQGYDGPPLAFVIKIAVPVLKSRADDGETPTFGNLLANLTPDKAESLQVVLTAALDSPLREMTEPLQAELDQWRANFIDRDILRGIGRIWEAEGTNVPLVLDHLKLLDQVQDVMRALTQSPRRSVLLTGEHGVGKTAVVRRVGRELMTRGWLVFEASGADMIAGQKYIGDLEQRLKELVQQIGDNRQVLWYAPDFQSLAWSGTHQYSRSSVLDLILPQLESGQIVLVGELPAAAYEQLVQDLPRLVTACETCRVPPLGEKATLELAADWARAASAADDPPLLAEVTLNEAWLLARQYLRDREPPGCLLDFLAQTLKQVRAATTGPVRITRDSLITALAMTTSLPRQILDDRQTLDPEQLRSFFDQRILGQPEAVSCLIERVTLIKAGLTDPSRPQGVFLFAGPTGTGKTEIAKALAAFLFGSEDRLLRYDMSEFQSPESLERLVGDGQKLDRESLTLKIRKQPFSVILLDEFEKAHPKVWDLFLQVFDDGRLTDPMGRTADFRHAIIILTSNLGGQDATGKGLGFDQDQEGFRITAVDRAVERAFRPEFLNRLDRVVVFRPFTREVMREILAKELADVQKRRGLRNRQWDVVWEDLALEFLLDKGFSPTLGARPLKRAIEQYLLTPLAETIVKGEFPSGDQFLYIHVDNNRLRAEFIDPEAKPASGPAAAQAGDDPGARIAEGAPDCLAAIAMHPSGTQVEFESLTRHWQWLRGQLDAPAWKEAKSLALSMTALPDFWSSPERHAVLGEVEYRERIETGVATAGGLLRKIAAPSAGLNDRYPGKLVGKVAGRLHLLKLACLSLESKTPWEAFVLIESKQGPGGDDTATDEWVDRLGDMYRQWGQNRGMRVTVLADEERRPGRSRSLMLAVSGYASYAILAPEAGLHVWEQPGGRQAKGSLQYMALVRVVALPEDRVVEGDDALRQAGNELLGEPLPGAPPMVRVYREAPDPLVKDRSRGWRTGRLERVLGGDFDLLGACAEHEAAAAVGKRPR